MTAMVDTHRAARRLRYLLAHMQELVDDAEGEARELRRGRPNDLRAVLAQLERARSEATEHFVTLFPQLPEPQP